jgi:hypothetical protein
VSHPVPNLYAIWAGGLHLCIQCNIIALHGFEISGCMLGGQPQLI